MSYPLSSDIIKGFAPGWFASVMGTGVLATTTLALSQSWQGLQSIAWVFHVFNLGLFLALAIPWLLRWVLFRSAAWATLNHPVQANFYPTFSIAILVLSGQSLAFGLPIFWVKILWASGAILTYLFSFLILFRVFINEFVAAEHITPAQFIPAVGLVVIPLTGIPLLQHLEGTTYQLALLINILGLGAGSLMYIGIFCLTVFRLYLHKPAFGILTPTIWIQLAPIGIIPVDLMKFSAYFAFPNVQAIALLFWGAGIWWLIMAILMTLTALKRKVFPFALSWWGFIFPLGAFLGLCLHLSHELHYPFLQLASVGIWGLMLSLWGITLLKTLRGVLSGAVFQPHP